MIRYTLRCYKCNLSAFIFPMDREDFERCPECNSRDIELSQRTEVR